MAKYRDCCGYILTRIPDVKQHLARRHIMPLYCPGCGALFENEEERDAHIVQHMRNPGSVNNNVGEVQRPEGITKQQREQLKKRVPSNLTPAEQWFTVFDIVFPGHQPRPASAYIDRDLLMNVTHYQEYLTRHGPTVIHDVLMASGAVTWTLPNEERDLSAFRYQLLEEGLRLVFDLWASEHGIPAPEPSVRSGSAAMADSITSVGGEDGLPDSSRSDDVESRQSGGQTSHDSGVSLPTNPSIEEPSLHGVRSSESLDSQLDVADVADGYDTTISADQLLSLEQIGSTINWDEFM
jgi:hypothetical protein